MLWNPVNVFPALMAILPDQENSKFRFFLEISLCAAYGPYMEYIVLIETAFIPSF